MHIDYHKIQLIKAFGTIFIFEFIFFTHGLKQLLHFYFEFGMGLRLLVNVILQVGVMSIYDFNLITGRDSLGFYHLVNCVDEELGVWLQVFDACEFLFLVTVCLNTFFAQAVICTSVDKKNFHDGWIN